MSIQKPFRAVPIGEISEVNPKGPGKAKLKPDVELDFLPMADLHEDGSVHVTVRRRYEEVAKGYTAFKDGDVLIAKITPCFENNKIGVAKVKTEWAFGSTEYHVLRPSGRVDASYLTHFLRQDSVRNEGEKRMTGSGGQRRVPKAFVEDLQIPLPPLEEQRRIAAILDQADALRRLRRTAIAKLSALGQSMFYEMFGDPVSNPMGWPEHRRLGEVSEIVSGITKGRKLNGQQTREVPYLAVVNVQDRHLCLAPLKTIYATDAEIEKYKLKENDLLLTEGGDPDKLGRGTLWRNEIPECIHQNHVFRVRLKDVSISPVFLNWIVGSTRGKTYFLRSAKQTTGIASINMTQLKGFPLLIPPTEVQRKFEERIGQHEDLVTRLKESERVFDNLVCSLQQRAFNGEL